MRQLRPWQENIGKRQVRSPKVYVRDCDLLHALLNLPTQRDLENHPKAGASWEGFIIEQILHDLGLASLTVIHAGEHSFALAKNVLALSWRAIVREIGPLP